MADEKTQQQSQPQPAAQPAAKPAAPAASPGQRPLGVTILSILGILVSLLIILSGVTLAGLSGMVGSAMNLGILTGNAMIVGVIFLVLGIVDLIAYIMLFKMKRIGWLLVTVLGVISILMGIATDVMSNVITIVITALIIIYLYTKRQLFV